MTTPPRPPTRTVVAPAVFTVLVVALLAACGGPSPAAVPPVSTPQASTPPATAPAPSSTAPSSTAGTPVPAGTLVWPVRDAAAADRLQRDVDGGRQPWLLDPAEVATSYAGGELGYRDPRATPAGTGVVGVRDGDGPASATITLTQPVRRGDGGIWIITGVRRG